MTGPGAGARALVALGVVLATAGLLAVFVRVTALDDNEARSLAHALIIRPDLRAQVASALERGGGLVRHAEQGWYWVQKQK